MSGQLEITILGCGSSAGVPRADGNWGVCDPANRRNWRSRCSLLVRRLGDGPDQTTVVVDAAPEFRLQCAAARVKRLDALLLTHDHADQCHGVDDIRAFALIQRKRIPVWMDPVTDASMMRRFGYIFEGEGGYPSIAERIAMPQLGEPALVDGPSGAIPVVAFDQDHGYIRSLGYRFGNIAYSADVVGLPPESMRLLEGLDLWIVDALRDRPHPTHAHVDMALEWIDKLKPKRAVLTNLHIDLDYEDLRGRLPAGVEPAFDGWRTVIDL